MKRPRVRFAIPGRWDNIGMVNLRLQPGEKPPEGEEASMYRHVGYDNHRISRASLRWAQLLSSEYKSRNTRSIPRLAWPEYKHEVVIDADSKEQHAYAFFLFLTEAISLIHVALDFIVLLFIIYATCI